MSEYKRGDRVRVFDPTNELLIYEGLASSGATGTVLRLRNGKIRVEIDNTGSQDTEGNNAYSDFDAERLSPLPPSATPPTPSEAEMARDALVAVKGEDVLDSEVEACLIGLRSRDGDVKRLEADYKRLGRVTESFRISWHESAAERDAAREEIERWQREWNALQAGLEEKYVKIRGEARGAVISAAEAEVALLRDENARLKARLAVLREALERIVSFCPEGRISIVPQKAIQEAAKTARAALAKVREVGEGENG